MTILKHKKRGREGERGREKNRILRVLEDENFPVYGDEGTKKQKEFEKNSVRNKEAFIVKIYQRSIFNRTGFDLVVLAPALL